jgi:hypothetical protein
METLRNYLSSNFSSDLRTVVEFQKVYGEQMMMMWYHAWGMHQVSRIVTQRRIIHTELDGLQHRRTEEM